MRMRLRLVPAASRLARERYRWPLGPGDCQAEEAGAGHTSSQRQGGPAAFSEWSRSTETSYQSPELDAPILDSPVVFKDLHNLGAANLSRHP